MSAKAWENTGSLGGAVVQEDESKRPELQAAGDPLTLEDAYESIENAKMPTERASASVHLTLAEIDLLARKRAELWCAVWEESDEDKDEP